MTESHIFEPIPSLGGKYEINRLGKVRNAKTKRPLKPYRNTTYGFHVQKKLVRRSRQSLLWEVFGVIPKKPLKEFQCEVIVIKEKCVFRFNSFAECARFLSKKIFYSKSYLINMMSRRKKRIGDCRFVYP